MVPAYNEAARITETAGRLAKYFRRRRLAFEVILVNDGSRDTTGAEIVRLARRWPEVKALSYPANRGKGHALRKGILASRGARVLFLDADLSTKPEEWPKLERALAHGADLAIGSRKMRGAMLVRRQPWWRERLGKVFTWLVRRLLVRVSDATCGFKAFTGAAARDLFSRSRLDDWSFDAEVLYLAERSGYRITEVPVVWKDNPNSKVRIVGAAVGSLLGLVRIRLNDALGRYGRRRG